MSTPVNTESFLGPPASPTPELYSVRSSCASEVREYPSQPSRS